MWLCLYYPTADGLWKEAKNEDRYDDRDRNDPKEERCVPGRLPHGLPEAAASSP